MLSYRASPGSCANVLALVLGERGEERVHQKAVSPGVGRGEPQRSVLDDEAHPARDDVDVVALDPLRVVRDPDGKVGRAGEDLGEEALVLRVEVLHEDVGEPPVGGEPCQKALEGLEAPRRGADAHDEKTLPFASAPLGFLRVAGAGRFRFAVEHGRHPLCNKVGWHPLSGTRWSSSEVMQIDAG